LKIEKDLEAPLEEPMGVLAGLFVGVDGVAGEERSWCLKENEEEGVCGEAAEEAGCLGGVCRRFGDDKPRDGEGEFGGVRSLAAKGS
jgi:hypothetical protein